MKLREDHLSNVVFRKLFSQWCTLTLQLYYTKTNNGDKYSQLKCKKGGLFVDTPSSPPLKLGHVHSIRPTELPSPSMDSLVDSRKLYTGCEQHIVISIEQRFKT